MQDWAFALETALVNLDRSSEKSDRHADTVILEYVHVNERTI